MKTAKSASLAGTQRRYTTITVDEETASKLRAAAERLGIEPEKLLKDALTSLFRDSDEAIISRMKGGAS